MDIYVKNKSFQTVGVIDIFESLIWTDRYYEPGDFELYLPITSELLSILQEDFYLQIKESDRTMIIESIQIKTDSESGNKLIVKGRSLESMLERRVVWDQTLLDTNVQSGISQIIHDAFIAPAGAVWDPYRQVNNMIWLTNSDPLVTTPTIKAQYFLEYVSDVVWAICKQSFISFRLVLNEFNQFVASVYSGSDRSYAQAINSYIVFSPNYDNLLSSMFVRTNKYFKTLAVILAQVDTEIGSYLRVTSGLTDPSWQTFTGINHRELFVDAQHIPDIFFETGAPIDGDTYLDQVRQYGREQLEKNSILSSFDGQVGTVKFKYLIDYFLGDIIQIENEYNMTSRSRIIEVTISENLSGRNIYPTFEPL